MGVNAGSCAFESVRLVSNLHSARAMVSVIEMGMVILEFARIMQLEVSAHAGDVGGTLG